MTCTLCGFSETETILAKQEIPIFTNADDESKKDFPKHSCILKQCRTCGHVFQPTTKKLRTALENIYHSGHAQITTSPGMGNWGTERAKYLFDKLKGIDKYKTKSVLEVGCGNGYMLNFLRDQGFEDLVGIDPSIKRTKKIDGVQFLNEFISKELKLDTKFEFIFSFGVYEHIDDIDSITNFCTNHLEDDGMLFIYVPNCKKGLTVADPALFAHEHLQYFVPNSIKYHLSKHGYEVIDNQSDDHAIAVYAKKYEGNAHEGYIIESYKQFQTKIDEKLEMVKNILCNNNVLIHGACNSLNNILGWLDGEFDYNLIDNDNTKYGKIFFNKKVESFSTIDLNNFDTVLILPVYFSDEIKTAYIKKGFCGEFVTIA